MVLLTVFLPRFLRHFKQVPETTSGFRASPILLGNVTMRSTSRTLLLFALFVHYALALQQRVDEEFSEFDEEFEDDFEVEGV